MSGAIKNSRISFVIVTRDRSDFIPDCINSIARTAPETTEVAVIDNSLTQDTEKVVQVLIQQVPKLKIFYYRMLPTETILSAGRNFGAGVVSGEIIAFVDDDTVLSEEWYSECLKGFSTEQIGAVGGRIIEPQDADKDAKEDLPVGKLLPNGKCSANFYIDTSEPVQIDHIRGCNWAVRRDVFDKLGGFSGNLRHVFEETELCFRIRRMGYRIMFLPKMWLEHRCGPRAHFLRQRDPKLFWIQQRAATKSYVFLLLTSVGILDKRVLHYLFLTETGVAGFFSKPSKEAATEIFNLLGGKISGLIWFLRSKIFVAAQEPVTIQKQFGSPARDSAQH